jgi:hypothetical protein
MFAASFAHSERIQQLLPISSVAILFPIVKLFLAPRPYAVWGDYLVADGLATYVLLIASLVGIGVTLALMTLQKHVEVTPRAYRRFYRFFAIFWIGLILSGGNIDLITLSSIIQRGLVRSGRLVRLVVGIPDIPGALSHVTQILGDLNANIMEIRHQRTFSRLSLKLAEVEIVIQALGSRHVEEIQNSLEKAGYPVTFPDIERIHFPSAG